MSQLAVEVEKRLAGHGKDFRLDVCFQTEALTTVLFGPSGAGKTTLLRAVAGLLRPDRGRIALDDRLFFDSHRGVMLPPYRRRLGMVFQQPSLFPHMTARENVSYAAPVPSRHEAEELLERFHVLHVARRRPLQISGGEQQRVAIARALAAKPRLLLLDEPLPAVDATTRASVLKDLLDYQKEHQVPFLYVTHNRVEALRLGGQALLIDEGRVLAGGKAEAVLSSPTSPEAVHVLGPDNVLAGTVVSHWKEAGLSRVELGGVAVYVPYTAVPLGSAVAVTIPCSDIIVSSDSVARTSAPNLISGRVERVLQLNSSAEVLVETPVRFRAHMTRSAFESLALRPGTPVHLLLNATAVVVDPL